MTTLNRTITQSADDAQESGGTAVINGTTLNIGQPAHYIGLRFQNITIPAGSTINSAVFQGNVVSTSLDDPDILIYCQDHDNATAFAAGSAGISGRTLTTANTPWSATNIGAGYQTSPDFAAAVQEVIDRGGWASGNALALILKGNSSSSNFRLVAYDDGGGSYTNLIIDYTAPGSNSQPRRTLHQFRMRYPAL